MQFIKFNFY